MHLRTGHRLDAELLPRAAEGPAAQQIIEAGRKARDIEVALVQGNGACQARIRVDADAENQTAGGHFLNVDENVLEGTIRLGFEHLNGGAAALAGVGFKDAQPG